MIEMILMIAIISTAVLTVELKNLLHSVGCLSLMGICIFGLLNAQFVMAFQMLVFVGATMVLFVAVVMLTERGET